MCFIKVLTPFVKLKWENILKIYMKLMKLIINKRRRKIHQKHKFVRCPKKLRELFIYKRPSSKVDVVIDEKAMKFTCCWEMRWKKDWTKPNSKEEYKKDLSEYGSIILKSDVRHARYVFF